MKNRTDYVYLDTNIIVDFKIFDKEMWELFKKASKKYYFPFSHAHLFDLQNSPDNYLNEDLDLLEIISDGYGLKKIEEDGKFSIVKLNSKLSIFFKHVIENKEKDYDVSKADRMFFLPDYNQYKVELAKMNKNSFLTDMVKKNNGVIDGNFSNMMMTYLIDNMDSPSAYKSVRKQIQEIIAHSKKYNTFRNMPKQFIGFLEIFAGSVKEDECFEKLVAYRTWALKLLGQDFSKLSEPEKIVDIYMSLDLVKDFSENISSKNRWTNMLRDAEHCGNASQSKYFITKEKNNKKKYDFIKRGFNLKYQEIALDSLLFRFA